MDINQELKVACDNYNKTFLYLKYFIERRDMVSKKKPYPVKDKASDKSKS